MLTGQIKQFWLESGCVYGYRKIHLDLRDTGQQCGVNRVWRLMKRAGIKAQVGYRSPRARKGEASIVTPNRLQRQFNPDSPDERWVTDITYIRTHEGWLYLAVVVDLFSRKVIGWSMQPRMTKEIVSYVGILFLNGSGYRVRDKGLMQIQSTLTMLPPSESCSD